jgi:hypothetical protein
MDAVHRPNGSGWMSQGICLRYGRARPEMGEGVVGLLGGRERAR